MRHIRWLLFAMIILCVWTGRARAVILPVHDYSFAAGEWHFGVTDWANEETTIYFGPWQTDSPLSARGALAVLFGVLIAIMAATTARIRLRTRRP